METDVAFQHALSVAIAPYRELLERFVRREMSADEFESEYLNVYLNDDVEGGDAVFAVVDRFFTDVDSYVGDPDLRTGVHYAIGADELRSRAESLLHATAAG